MASTMLLRIDIRAFISKLKHCSYGIRSWEHAYAQLSDWLELSPSTAGGTGSLDFLEVQFLLIGSATILYKTRFHWHNVSNLTTTKSDADFASRWNCITFLDSTASRLLPLVLTERPEMGIECLSIGRMQTACFININNSWAGCLLWFHMIRSSYKISQEL